jgi:hypothetical protein
MRLVEALHDRGWLERGMSKFRNATFLNVEDSNVAFLNSETALGGAS